MTVSEIKHEAVLLTMNYYFVISESEKTKNKRVSVRDNKLIPSCDVFCQYLLGLVYLIEKSRWVHVEYTQHYIDRSLYEPKKTWLKSSLHMVSLHKHCLKNATSEAIASLHKYCLKKHDLRSSSCMVSLHKYCLKKHDFGSPLRMASLHNIASKNATSENTQ